MPEGLDEEWQQDGERGEAEVVKPPSDDDDNDE